MHEQLIVVQASAPVRVRVKQGADLTDLAALGIGFICEGNPHRQVMQKAELSPELLSYLQSHPFQTELWMAQGYSDAPLEPLEIQPFLRSLRGHPFLFSMLGSLTGIEDPERFPLGDHWPLSCLDRERAFCLLLERLRRLWQEGYPDTEMRLALMADYASRLRQLESHSFTCWDGSSLYAYSDGSEHQGLSYLQTEGTEFSLTNAVLPLEITADETVEITMIGTHSLMGSDAKAIENGQICSFVGGKLDNKCDPVKLWG
ncbi:class II glutamine amidotransferase [Neptuniibacter sp. CAU 1671]|uniref:class II glutamine amidotransferase n=1 Tax=Neptuniibacter sp. CAU 1671 TaxID=3032593 RepID=UPI0023D9B590|nr:class II glutamine amidotransferase [Neptuniibacter sp. CAU 1671]MDF2182001.1 class II glutamine amidotransferase [Neptuniibacter sp. CAU 1671]